MKKLKILGLLMVMVMGITACGNTVEGTSSEPVEVPVFVEPVEAEEEKKPETMYYEVDLGSGIYTAGIDIPMGTYNLKALTGGGNVYSSNLAGINELMGVIDNSIYDEQYKDLFISEYKNLFINNGVSLSISGGVRLRLTSEDASTKPLEARNQRITEVIPLSNGRFTSGKHFPAGVYNIRAISGNGNVSTFADFTYTGGINAIMGIGDESPIDIYEMEYKNIDLIEGVILDVSGVQIELTPSK